MYEASLDPVNDPWFGPDATWHVGTRQQAATRMQLAVQHAAHEGPQAIQDVGKNLLNFVADARVLREAWDYLSRYGGQAPGPNGRRYADLDNSEVWELLRALSKAIKTGTYRTGPMKPVTILKNRQKPDLGTRTLLLLNIEDRVVQRAILEVLWPLLERDFAEISFGFRRQLDRRHALAYVFALSRETKRMVVLSEDLRDAFDHVPRGPLMELVAKSIPNDELNSIIEKHIKTESKHGVPQGGALSPTFLNVYLHRHLDRRWRKENPDIPLIRYADDLLIMCRTKTEAKKAWKSLKNLVQPTGLMIKSNSPNDNLFDFRKGERVDWLGYDISWESNDFKVEITERAWDRLADKLELAHEEPNSPIVAVSVINGWVDQLGPTYPLTNKSEAYQRIQNLAHNLGFDEIPSRDAISSRWKRVFNRWEDIRNPKQPTPQISTKLNEAITEEGMADSKELAPF